MAGKEGDELGYLSLPAALTSEDLGYARRKTFKEKTSLFAKENPLVLLGRCPSDRDFCAPDDLFVTCEIKNQ